MQLKTLAAAIAIAALSFEAHSQPVFEATNVTLQPQIGRGEHGFDSCGIRAIVITADGKFLEAYDFSLAVRPDIYHGMLKGGKRRMTIDAASRKDKIPSAVTPAPIKFWIAQELRGKPLLGNTASSAEDQGFTLMLGDLVETYLTINAIINGERMHFALRYGYEKSDMVISFSGKLPREQIDAVQACMASVLDQLKAKAGLTEEPAR